MASKWITVGSSPVPNNTRIVRYMKMSTFLMLLCGRAFIPRLETLQKMDQQEGVLPISMFGKNYGVQLKNILELHESWLLERTSGRRNRKEEQLQFLAKVWLAELAKRRCVWCWNKFVNESYAMWQIYGQKGVAVQTTVGRVKEALKKSGPLRGLVARVSYVLPARTFLVGTDKPEARRRMSEPGYLTRPYLFKEVGYKYEEEIRFTFGIDPELSVRKTGINIEFDLWGTAGFPSRPDNIALSPDIPESERRAIQVLIKSANRKDIANWQIADEEFDETVDRSAFTMSDDPLGLFTDLD